MPRSHSEAAKAKMRAAAFRTWEDPEVRAARIRGLREHNSDRHVTKVLIRQHGVRDVALAVSSWDGNVPVVDLADQPIESSS